MKPLYKFLLPILLLAMLVSPVKAAETPLITTVSELTAAMSAAEDGDTLLVGDITFKPMPMGMITVPKNLTLKSGKDGNAVFTNATFALNGSVSDAAPLTVQFENIDFRGDAATPLDPAAPPNIAATMPGIMKTMCAAIFKLNVNAAYTGCTFEGYHYGYGGVFSAIYSSADNNNTLNLTLNNCTFKNNAAKYGGCVYLSGADHNVSLQARHCVFDENIATTGGAVWAEDALVGLTDCTFVGNRYFDTAIESPNGGALALYNSGVDMNGCLIADNTSGGEGAGVFCEISPFRTLIMENCTVIGNTANEDEGISLVLAKTNYDTEAAAHICFSSLFGKQNLRGSAQLFGCLLVTGDAATVLPSEQNDYCLELSPEEAERRGLMPKTPTHVTLPPDEQYAIPAQATAAVAGGKYSDSLGTLQVGDNYQKQATVEIKSTPHQTETVTLAYGDKPTLETPERSGYAFDGWEYPKGTPLTDNKVFVGGTLPNAPIEAKWHFELSQNLYVIWVPLALLALLGGFLVWRKKKKAPAAPVAPAAAADVLPKDWIERACQKSQAAAQISKREMDVLRRLLEGKSRKQIAEELFVTEATIRKHSTSIYAKLDVHNRTELIYKLTK